MMTADETVRMAVLDAEVFVARTEPANLRPGGPSADFWRQRLRSALASDLEIDAPSGEPPAARVAGDPIGLSFARTAGHRVCAVRRPGPVGVDAERVAPLPEIERMIEIAAGETEAARCRERTDPCAGFIDMWTRKEAVLKLAGTGLRVDPKRVTIDEPADGTAIARLDGRSFTTRVVLNGDLVIAVAIPEH